MTDQEWEELTHDIDWARWTITCRMMITRIVQGQMDGAHEALRYFCREPRRALATGESHVCSVFSAGVASSLERGNLFTVDAVRMATDEQLRQCGNLGEVRAAEVRTIVDGVMAGTVYETYGDIDLTELIDEEVCVRSLPSARHGVRSAATELVTQRESIAVPKESRTMTNEEQVIQALELLVQSPDTVNEAVDKQIAVLESEIEKRKTEIARLKKMQRSFGLVEKKVGKSAGGKQSKRDAIEEKIFVYVKANGPTGVATIAKHLDMMATVIGKTVSTSTRLAKDAATNRVVIKPGA